MPTAPAPTTEACLPPRRLAPVALPLRRSSRIRKLPIDTDADKTSPPPQSSLDLRRSSRIRKRRVDDDAVTGDAVDPCYADGVGSDFSDVRAFALYPNCLLDPRGRYLDHNSEWRMRFCRDCWSHSSHGRVPPLSLANHNYIGPVPSQLRDLTFIEELMIARCRAKVCVIKMYKKTEFGSPTDAEYSPVIQRGLKGNIIVFPQEPSELAEILPPSVEEMCAPIVMVFVGNSPPTDDWLREKATPLLVRPAYLRDALLWLRADNPLYEHIQINDDELDAMPEDFILPVNVEHLNSVVSSEVSTSRYDSATADNNEPESEDIRFENIVMTNLKEAATADQMKLLTSKHVKENNSAFLQVPHDINPANEFYNKTLFPSMYPTLYPYGLGGFENTSKSVNLSFQRQVRRCFSLDDKRFQEHRSFLFATFNILQRREILRRTKFRIQKKSFERFARESAEIDPEIVRKVSEKMETDKAFKPESADEAKVLGLMREVNSLMSSVPGSAASKKSRRNEIRALQIELGLPCFFITINPADMYNPLVKVLAGEDIDTDALTDDDHPRYFSQSSFISCNPSVGSEFFNIYVNAFISALLGYDSQTKGTRSGVLGHVSGYYGLVEAQGRGTLHCHMLVWMHGSLDPNSLKDRVLSDPDFQRRMVDYLDDAITTSVPDDCAPHASIPLSRVHPASVRGLHPHGDADHQTLRRKDLHCVANRSQRHKHSATCYNHCRGKNIPQTCRFKLHADNTEPKTYFDSETGELFLRKLDGLVNNFNEPMLEALRNNMDIKFVGSGTAAKAVLYYITDYITKTPMKTYAAYATLELAIKRLGDPDNHFYDTTNRAKSLLHKCAFAMVGQQELSAQQVMHYIMGRGDYYTSHQFRSLYWPSVDDYVDARSKAILDGVDQDFEWFREDDSIHVQFNEAGHAMSRGTPLEDYMH